MNTLIEGVPWFPQEYAQTFYLIKGALALVATILLLIHMNREWAETTMSHGRRLRYLALLYFAALMTASTAEQTSQDALVNYRNIGALIGAVLLNIAAIVSIRESHRQDR